MFGEANYRPCVVDSFGLGSEATLLLPSFSLPRAVFLKFSTHEFGAFDRDKSGYLLTSTCFVSVHTFHDQLVKPHTSP